VTHTCQRTDPSSIGIENPSVQCLFQSIAFLVTRTNELSCITINQLFIDRILEAVHQPSHWISIFAIFGVERVFSNGIGWGDSSMLGFNRG